MTQIPHPPRCHYDRALGERVTRDHDEPCRHPHGPDDCGGCIPCYEPHCSVCGREHLDDAHPNTCPTCVAGVREDLAETLALCQQLRAQAVDAESYTWASARIPGATAMILISPFTGPEDVRMTRTYVKDHFVPRNGRLVPADPTPPLAILAAWEDRWRSWLGHEHRRRAGVGTAVGYLDRQLTAIAQARPRYDLTPGAAATVTAPPEFPEFSRAIGHLRANLEATLHNEQQPDRGVECFECGARLVRRHRDRRRCHHQTPARAWFAAVLSYPELGLPTPVEVKAAVAPCAKCDQGGLVDPTPGISWECPSCRMSYSPGEYATAVRRDLLDSDDGDGWTDIVLAADAASTLTGRLVPASTVRKWMDRAKVASMCAWRPGEFWGQRLVYWPDVAARATDGGTRRAS